MAEWNRSIADAIEGLIDAKIDEAAQAGSTDGSYRRAVEAARQKLRDELWPVKTV